MRPSEDPPLDPQALAELEAIDATLAGEIVDPIHAEMAELALFLAAERPPIPDDVAGRLDAAVGRRFAPAPSVARGRGSARRRRRGFGLALRPVLGVALAAFAAVVVVVALNGGGSSRSTNSLPTRASRPGALEKAAPTPARHAVAGTPAPSRSATSSSSATFGASGTTALVAPTVAAPAPVPNGRRQIQSADLQLVATNERIEAVSQELFRVVGQENGIVKHSTVTAATGNGGYASFTLSIPSGNLQDAMTRLSELPYSHVASRTDATQDVNDQYLSDERRLQDARTLRTSLLKQLAAATTETEIDSLTAQIHDAEASISSDEATLRGLQGRISFSSLSVEINAGTVPVPVAKHDSTGFTLRRAAHDAVRVLTVAAGVALIVLAALVPVGLIVGLGAWIAAQLRRRRREQALDAV